MRGAATLALVGLGALPAAAQGITQEVYRCFVESAETTPASPLTLSQFTLHWRPATPKQSSTLKLLHEYFSNAPLTPHAVDGIAGTWAGADAQGRSRTATVTPVRQHDNTIGIHFIEPFDLRGEPAQFAVTARCLRQ